MMGKAQGYLSQSREIPMGKKKDDPKSLVAYKAFDKNLQCRGYQYEIGKTYEHNGSVVACGSGFHSCENPLDCFRYYDPGTSVFHAVEASGEIDRHDEDSKVASSEIKIGAAISLHNLIGASIKFMLERKYLKKTSKHSTGDSSASSSTGDSSASSSTGYRSASSSTGDSSASSSTGDRSASSATGDSSAAVCTGLNSKAMAGKYGCIALAWWNEAICREEMKCAETGCGDGSDGKLKAEVWYVLGDDGNFKEFAG